MHASFVICHLPSEAICLLTTVFFVSPEFHAGKRSDGRKHERFRHRSIESLCNYTYVNRKRKGACAHGREKECEKRFDYTYRITISSLA